MLPLLNLNNYKLDSPQAPQAPQSGGSSLPPLDLNKYKTVSDGTIQGAISNPDTKDAATKAVLSHATSLGTKLANGLSAVSGGISSVMNPLSNFVAGSTGKAVGGLITSGIGAGESLYGTATGNKDLEAKGNVLSSIGQAQATPGNIVFSALEMYPGGEILTKSLSKIPVVGEKIATLLSKLPEAMKAKQIEKYSKIFNATSKDSKALVEKVVPDLIKQGQVFANPANLANKAEGLATKYGGEIDNFISKLPDTAKTTIKPALDALEKMKSEAAPAGKILDEAKHNAASKVQSLLAQYGDKISSKDTIEIRRVLDGMARAGKSGVMVSEKLSSQAADAGANAIRNELAKQYPKLADINAKFTLWKGVQDLADYTSKKSKGVLERGVGAALGGAAGFELGQGILGKTGGTIAGIGLGAYGGKVFVNMIKSPAWRSLSSVTKYKLADEMMKHPNLAVQMMNRIAAGTYNEATQQ